MGCPQVKRGPPKLKKGVCKTMQKKGGDNFGQLGPLLALAQVRKRGSDGHEPIGCGRHLPSRRVRILIFGMIIRIPTASNNSTSPRREPPQRLGEWRLRSTAIASWWGRKALAESGLFAPTAVLMLYRIFYL